MANLTARLLDPETFEEALKEMCLFTNPAIALAAAVSELHDRLRVAKAEGAAEAYEAEARGWTEQAVRAQGTYVDPGPGRMFERRAVEARDRAAAARKGIEAKEGK